jgi:hypothetical protein
MLTTMFKIEVERNLVMKCEISVSRGEYFLFGSVFIKKITKPNFF